GTCRSVNTDPESRPRPPILVKIKVRRGQRLFACPHLLIRFITLVHDSLHFYHWRRGFLFRKRPLVSGTRCLAASPRLQSSSPQIGSVPQCRSGHDEPVSAWR